MIVQPIRKPVLVDDNEWAVFLDYGDASSQVLWKVVGPQNVEGARRLALAVLEMTGGVPAAQVTAPVDVKKTRSVTAALREHLTTEMTEEEVWLAVKEEFGLGNDKRYRVREVKKELIKAGTITAEME